MLRRDSLALAFTLAALSAACSSGSEPAATGSGGSGGTGATTSGATTSGSSTGATTTTASSSVSSTVASTTGVGGGPPAQVCDPPAEPGSLWEIAEESYDISVADPVSMCKYRGDVLLIVNTAAA